MSKTNVVREDEEMTSVSSSAYVMNLRAHDEVVQDRDASESVDAVRSQPLVSVVMPAYNAERFISQALQSVVGQTYKNIEVLVVDDGSTDRTSQLVKSLQKEDKRIILFTRPHLGAVHARNYAITRAKGEFIAPIDADDFWDKDKLTDQVACMIQAGRKIGLVYSWSVMVDEEGHKVISKMTAGSEGKVFIDMILGNFVGNGSAALIRRSCLGKIGAFDVGLNDYGCEDWELYLRIAEHYEFRLVRKIHVSYRRVVDGLSSNHRNMEHASQLLIGGVRARYPRFPDSLFKLSQSSYYLYLTGRSNIKREYGRTLCYMLRALRLDPLLLLSPHFYLISLKLLLRLLALPATFLFRNDLNGQVVLDGKRQRESTLNSRDEHRLSAKARTPAGLHERIWDFRIKRIKKGLNGSPPEKSLL